MKRRARALLALLALAFLGWAGNGCSRAESASRAAAPPSAVYVVGISPFLEDTCKDDVYRRIAGLLLETLPLNSSLRIYDAYHLRTVTRVDIPSVAALRGGKARANQFKDEILALKHFLAGRHAVPEGLDWSNAVRLPQFLKFIGDHLHEGPVRVMILGSPVYVDAKEPTFSMVNGFYPSDGHLAATEEQSIFGIKHRPRGLENVRVCLGYFGDPWMSELHQEKVARFWNLFVRGQGGVLASFGGDLPTLFAAFASDQPTAAKPKLEVDPAGAEIEMLRVTRQVGLTDWITDERPAHLRTRPPAREIGPLRIGIRWQGNVDLDLYSRPREGATTLSYRRVTSPDGYYFKDHRSSPRGEYEFIEFETPVNVRELEASVNFYDGVCPGGPEGEVRIEFDGGVYVDRFDLAAEQGNQGRKSASPSVRGWRDHWTELDIPRILRLQ